MNIPTNEPIEIGLEDMISDVLITVDGIDYAVISNCSIDDLDLDNVKNWVEETYYDNSYLSSAYVAAYMSSEGFLK